MGTVAGDRAPAILLVATTAIALVWANSTWGETYAAVWETRVTVGPGDLAVTEPLIAWINDGLMAVFFLGVGLEMKRELLDGELSSLPKATLPLAAAAGGMLFPALIFAWINTGTDGTPGWGIPVATDIAFALGILALAGSGVPQGLRVFLISFAVADDLGAVIVIALFYRSGLDPWHLLMAAGYVAVLIGANRLRVMSVWVYAVVGIVGVWHCFLLSGIHPTIAGVLVAATVPARSTGATPAPLPRLEAALRPWGAYLILPLFALANAGVRIEESPSVILTHPTGLGVFVGLVIGKQLGITSATWLFVRRGWAALPSGTMWRDLYAVSWLGGIGFTMSLFISSLAFRGTDHLPIAKVAVMSASLVSGSVGWILLRRLGPETPPRTRGEHEPVVND